MARKTNNTPKKQQKKKVAPTSADDDKEQQIVVEQPTVAVVSTTTTTTTTTKPSSTTTESSSNKKSQKKQSSTKKQAITAPTTTTNANDSDDEDEKIDPDELSTIFKQFDKASNAFAGRQVEEEDEEDEASKIQLTDDVVPENDKDLVITTNPKSKKYQAPSVHFFTHIKKRFLKIQITLHKIPQKHMLLNLENDHFSIDTTGYTKKMFLERKYPGLVKVDPSNPKAELLKGDILTVWVPIVSMPQATYDKELAIIEGRIKEKTIKFQPEVKKIIAIRAKQAAKKSEQKKRRREKEKFYEQGLDIKKNKKQKTSE